MRSVSFIGDNFREKYLKSISSSPHVEVPYMARKFKAEVRQLMNNHLYFYICLHVPYVKYLNR